MNQMMVSKELQRMFIFSATVLNRNHDGLIWESEFGNMECFPTVFLLQKHHSHHLASTTPSMTRKQTCHTCYIIPYSIVNNIIKMVITTNIITFKVRTMDTVSKWECVCVCVCVLVINQVRPLTNCTKCEIFEIWLCDSLFVLLLL